MSSLSGRTQHSGAGQILAFLVVCTVWGSTFLALRIGVETVPPWTLCGLRCLFAGALLAGFALLRGARLPAKRALGSAAASGVLMFSCSQAMVAWAERHVPSGQAAVLSCTVSLLTPAISWWMGAAGRPSPLAVAGLLVGFLGVVVLAHPNGGAGDQVARLVVLGSALAWAVGAAIARRVPPAGSALLGSGLQLLAGAPAALAFAWARGEWTHLDPAAISGRSLLAMAYLVVMGSIVAFACFGWLVQIWAPERLSTYAFVNPVVALGLGAALMGEPLGLREAVATALILGAVGLVMMGNRSGVRWPRLGWQAGAAVREKLGSGV
jgi:drug/metabolite transporter (DMT)-like permease